MTVPVILFLFRCYPIWQLCGPCGQSDATEIGHCSCNGPLQFVGLLTYLLLGRPLGLVPLPVLLYQRLGPEQLRLGVQPVERVGHPEEMAEAPVEGGLKRIR